MERFTTIPSPKNPVITVQVINGHFTTSNAHITHYIDMNELKSGAAMAKDAARELAVPYRTAMIDIIVCMEGTEIIAAYLADELLHSGALMGGHDKIHIVTPMSNQSGQLVFHQNVQDKIYGKNILLMVASVSTGKTINLAMNCISYYGGLPVGIAAVFSAVPQIMGHDINALFTGGDIPGYRFYRANMCKLCWEGRKLEAIVDSGGYTQIGTQSL